jgi:long-chain acyl-CoA synthetase
MLAAFAAQCTLVMHYRFNPALAIATIRSTRPTFSIGAITAFNALMNVPDARADDLRSFEQIYSGGAPIPPSITDAFAAKFGVEIRPVYGMTETTAPTHLTPPNARAPIDPESGALSIGVPLPFTDARIVDDAGHPLPIGEAGEIIVRGPQVMAGYWGKPAETQAALRDGWMHTGDIGLQDENGWFYLVDRKKDMIIASGFKVWPREIEDALYAHPAIREAAVVGIPDAYRGESVKAYVSLIPGQSAEEPALIEHCRTLLAAYKVPRLVEILAELPKTVSGKIQRAVLRNRGGGQL